MKVLRHLRGSRNPFRLLMSRVLWRTGACRFFSIRTDKFKLRFYPSSLSAEYWEDPRTRRSDHDFIGMYLNEGDTYIDIGANIGALVQEASVTVGHGGKVFAFEAHPRIYSYLLGNMTKNQSANVTAYNLALGNQAGEMRFSDEIADDMNSASDQGGIIVVMDTLDNVLPDNLCNIALVKIDVEGFEKQVLEGAKRTLGITQCVYFEAWDTHFKKYGYTASDLIIFLQSLGFMVCKRESSGWAVIEPGYSALKCDNLYAVRDIQAFKNRLGE